jgi:hypothetical protein
MTSGMGTPSNEPCPISATMAGKPVTSPPRVRNSPNPRRKIIMLNETRIGCAPT